MPKCVAGTVPEQAQAFGVRPQELLLLFADFGEPPHAILCKQRPLTWVSEILSEGESESLCGTEREIGAGSLCLDGHWTVRVPVWDTARLV